MDPRSGFADRLCRVSEFVRGLHCSHHGACAGAMLAVLADTMIPEAFDEARNWAGLITAIGFLVAFVLAKSDG